MNFLFRPFLLTFFVAFVSGNALSQECIHNVAYCDIATGTLLETRTDSTCWEYVNQCDSILYTLKDGDTTVAIPITRFEMTDSSYILDLVLDFDVTARAEFLFEQDKIIVSSPEMGFFMIETARHRLCRPPSLEKLSGNDIPDFYTLMVVRSPYNAKGFIVDSDQAEKTVNLPCTDLEEKPDIRLFVEPLENDLFEVHYKYRSSRDFLVDTVSLYLVDDFYTVGLETGTFPTLPDNGFMMMHAMPASTDERDVVRACRTAEGKRVYIF